jgi:hypothetical protein
MANELAREEEVVGAAGLAAVEAGGVGGVGEAGEGDLCEAVEAGSTGSSGKAEASEAGAEVQAKGEGGIRLASARQSFASMRGELLAIPAGELVIVRVDLRRAGAIAHSVAVRDGAPERRKAFEQAAETGFCSITTLDGLPRLARGAWYVRRQQLRVLARASGALVSEEDTRLAYETRGRMMRVLEHWLGDRHDVATELKHLREGAGHEDLGTDLDTLAELYQRDDVRPLLEHDTKHYRASDVGEALRLVDIIFASLGLIEAGEVERANRLAQRAATLLLRAYNEHGRCGHFVFGNREDVSVTYPSLISAARSPRRKRKIDEPASGGGPSGGEEPAAGEGESGGGEAGGGEDASGGEEPGDA